MVPCTFHRRKCRNHIRYIWKVSWDPPVAEVAENQLQQYSLIEAKPISVFSVGTTCFWASTEGLQSLLQHVPNLWMRRHNPADAPTFVANLRH